MQYGIGILLFSIFAFPQGSGAQSPPGQPSWGPGGYDYPHANVTIRAYGSGADQYWIFEPAEPTPASAPVVAFYHGWGGIWPPGYGGFLFHLVRKGFIVIFPRYQKSWAALPWLARDNALGAVGNALEELQSGGHVPPDLDRFGVCGHSFGGAISAATGVLYDQYGLPAPRVIATMTPGAMPWCLPGGSYVWGDLSLIDPDTLLLVMVAEEDSIVCDTQGKEIYHQATDVLEKEYLVVRSDYYGEPDLVADHFSPATLYPMNALDFYGFWKIATAAMTCGFDGVDCEYAKGGGSLQIYMGHWSDGTLVEPMLRLTEP